MRNQRPGYKPLGWLILIAMNLVYLGLQIWLYQSTEKPSNQLIASIAGWTAFSLFLTIFMFVGMDWPRSVYMFMMGVKLVLFSTAFLEAHNRDTPLLTAGWAMAAANLVIFFTLLLSRSVRAVTKKLM